MSLLTTKRTFSRFQVSCALDEPACRARGEAVFPLEGGFTARRQITIPARGAHGSPRAGAARAALKSEIIVKIGQSLKRFKLLFLNMSDKQILVVLERINYDIEDAIRALAALSLNPAER